MTTITIYSPKGDIYEAPITKDARVFRQLGGDYYVELSFNVANVLPLAKGCYIDITDPTDGQSRRFKLKGDASPEPISGVNGYKYVLKFYSRQHDMEACQIKWLAGGSKELSFRVTTSLRGFAELIANNMNAYLDDGNAWSYDEELDDTDMREQSFEGVSCWEAINNIAKAFGVEWWVDHGDKLTIHFGKCENEEDAVDIREGEIVNRFPAPKRGDDSNYGTRFYIFGGSQNVPDTYNPNNNASVESSTFHIAEKRICLCEYTYTGGRKDYIPYFDAIEDLPQAEIVEKTIILNDIFPKNETTIGEGDIFEQKENIIDGKGKQPVYYIEVSKPPTVLSTLGITFTSGALSGRSFGAAYTTLGEVSYIKVLHTTENSGGASLIAVPNDNLKPNAGDTYILTGVELEPDRIKAAEYELWKKGTELARQYANDTNVYDCPVDPVYCSKDPKVNLALGAKVILKGAHFGEEGRKSRIQGYEKKLYNPYIATYNIGDNSVYSRTAKVIKDIQLPVAEAERKNDRLSAQISSMQSNTQLTSIIQRLNDIEGYDTDTAESTSIPGAKKYAEQVAEEAAKAEGEEVKKAVSEGIYGTKNFGIYAGTTFHGMSPAGGGIYVETTTQFDNVYDPDKEVVPPALNGGLQTEVTLIIKDDASKYNGAVIDITGNVGAGVLSNNALIANDVVMAVGGKWVKINDPNTEVTEEYVKSLLLSSDVQASIFKNLTGKDYANQVVDIKMPVVKVTKTSEQIGLFKPNTIYELRGLGTSDAPYKLPWLSTSGWREGDKWVIKMYQCYPDFTNWKPNTVANPARNVLWNTLPLATGGIYPNSEITAYRFENVTNNPKNPTDFYQVTYTTFTKQIIG